MVSWWRMGEKCSKMDHTKPQGYFKLKKGIGVDGKREDFSIKNEKSAFPYVLK